MSRELKCARCGASFLCRPDDIAACQCRDVQVPAEVRAEIAARYSDCLCVECLRELATEPTRRGD